MSKEYTQFKQLEVDSIFIMNGVKYFKRSSRTAEIIEPIEYKGKWFYFSNDDQVIIIH